MGDNSSWLIKAFAIIGFFTIAVLVAMLLNMKRAFEAKSASNKIKCRYSLIPIACIVAVIISWICNFGFLRLKLTIQSVPLIHMFALLMINLYAVKKADNSKRLRILLALMYATYVSAYLFMPDVSEGGMIYAFFGMIKDNETIIKMCNHIYPALFTANIIFMAAAGILAVSTKEKFTLPKKKKSDYMNNKKAR